MPVNGSGVISHVEDELTYYTRDGSIAYSSCYCPIGDATTFFSLDRRRTNNLSLLPLSLPDTESDRKLLARQEGDSTHQIIECGRSDSDEKVLDASNARDSSQLLGRNWTQSDGLPCDWWELFCSGGEMSSAFVQDMKSGTALSRLSAHPFVLSQ